MYSWLRAVSIYPSVTLVVVTHAKHDLLALLLEEYYYTILLPQTTEIVEKQVEGFETQGGRRKKDILFDISMISSFL